MHQDLPGGNTKLVLILLRPWALPPLGRVFGCLSGSFHLLEISIEHRLVVRLYHRASRPRVVHLAYLNEVQQCICINAWTMQQKVQQYKHKVTII